MRDAKAERDEEHYNFAVSVIRGGDGNYVVSGRGSGYGWLMKLDEAGRPVSNAAGEEWSYGYLTGAYTSESGGPCGGPPDNCVPNTETVSYDPSVRVVDANARGYFIVGVRNYATGGDWMAQVDADGRLVWAKSLGKVFQRTAHEGPSFARAHGGGYLLAKLPKKGFLRIFAGKRLLLVKVDEGGAVAWQKTLHSPDADEPLLNVNEPALLIRPLASGGYLLARDVLERSKRWPGSKEPADKGGGLLLKRWDETRRDEECVADADSKASLPKMKVERVKVRFVNVQTETVAKAAAGVARETSIAPAAAPACLVEAKK